MFATAGATFAATAATVLSRGTPQPGFAREDLTDGRHRAHRPTCQRRQSPTRQEHPEPAELPGAVRRPYGTGPRGDPERPRGRRGRGCGPAARLPDRVHRRPVHRQHRHRVRQETVVSGVVLLVPQPVPGQPVRVLQRLALRGRVRGAHDRPGHRQRRVPAHLPAEHVQLERPVVGPGHHPGRDRDDLLGPQHQDVGPPRPDPAGRRDHHLLVAGDHRDRPGRARQQPDLLQAVVGVGVFFVFVVYGLAAGFHLNTAAGLKAFLASPAQFTTLAQTYAPWLKQPVDLAAIAGLFSCMLAVLNTTVRVVYAMAREHIIHGSLSAVHPRFKSPFVAIYGVVGFAVV